MGYGTVTHGEAVAEGMRFAARVSVQTGRATTEFVRRQDRLLDGLGLRPMDAACRTGGSAGRHALRQEEPLRCGAHGADGRTRRVALRAGTGRDDIRPPRCVGLDEGGRVTDGEDTRAQRAEPQSSGDARARSVRIGEARRHRGSASRACRGARHRGRLRAEQSRGRADRRDPECGRHLRRCRA